MSEVSDGRQPAPPIPKAGEVLTLDDVRSADFSSVTPLAVLGYPIRHSVSPQMHNAALAELAKSDARFANWRYYRIEVPPDRLKEALELLAQKGFVGLNLTVPHKVMAMQWVSNIPNFKARKVGAINTLIRSRKGLGGQAWWYGDNTDIFGFEWAVMHDLRFDMQGADVVIIGAGGVSRAIICQCFNGLCKNLWIGNRSKNHLSNLVISVEIARNMTQLHQFDLADAANAGLPKSALVINATPLGLKPDDPSPIDLSIFGSGTKVFDTTYGKGFRSAFLRQADELGLPSCDGLQMLVYQGQESLKLWVEAADGKMTAKAANAMYPAAYSALGIPQPQR